MKIHAIQTGTVALTRSWREGVGHGKRRLLNTLFDREWTEPLPIYAFAIEHPEGVIVVDTGETARVGDPTTIELEAAPVGPFPQSLRLTKAGDVTVVPAAGHTPGQVAVLLEEHDHTVFIGGDTSYTEEAMLRGRADGVGFDEAAELLTHERIRAYAADRPTVYLVAHDPDTPARLAERRFVFDRAVAA